MSASEDGFQYPDEAFGLEDTTALDKANERAPAPIFKNSLLYFVWENPEKEIKIKNNNRYLCILYIVIYLYFKVTQKIALYCKFMKTIKRNIPNFITILNLICGISSIIALLKYELIYSGILIFAGAIFDLADGLLARALNVTSEIGKQLDSFADMVTFGIAPGVLMYQLIDNQTLDTI